MAQITIPIELPDDWYDRVADKLIEKGHAVIVTRCEDCKSMSKVNGKCWCECHESYIGVNDFCSYGERRCEE